MNYIRHLHAFYHHARHDNRLSPTHISLYMAMFQFWNYNRFQNPFRIERDELMQLSKIGSVNTYRKCIKDLHNYRYVFYHSGITKHRDAKLSIIRLDLKTEEKGLKQLDLFSPQQAPELAPHQLSVLVENSPGETVDSESLKNSGKDPPNTTQNNIPAQVFEKNKNFTIAIEKLISGK